MRFEYWLRRFEAEIFFCFFFFFFCLSYTSIVNLPEIFMITKKSRKFNTSTDTAPNEY